MDALAGLASPSPYSGVDRKQAWIVTQTVPQRRLLLPAPVVRSAYTLVCFQGIISPGNVGSGNMMVRDRAASPDNQRPTVTALAERVANSPKILVDSYLLVVDPSGPLFPPGPTLSPSAPAE